MIRWLERFILLNFVVILGSLIAPAASVALPLILLAGNPLADLSALAWALVFFGPVACAFWMILSCHWPSVRRWQREGSVGDWRDEHGGMVCTVAKSCFFMFAGLIGSFLFEILFSAACPFGSVPQGVWFALLPLATYSPLIVLWLYRWTRWA
jgi:hypothetical protein